MAKTYTVEEQTRREARWAARTRDTLTVLADLQTRLPEVWHAARVVGRWIWVSFDGPPAASIRETLLDMGFVYNSNRQTWQHACGRFTFHGSGDPRDKYGVVKADELQAA